MTNNKNKARKAENENNTVAYRNVAEDLVACSEDECHPLTKPLSTIAYDISNDVVITKQHHNTPLGKREEPVGDVVSRRINESGRKLRCLYRSGCHSYTNIKPGNMTRRRKLGSLMDSDL